MYALNTTAARQAEQRGGRVTEIGKYLGRFSRAEDMTSQKGTRGIDFQFETHDKQSAYFTIWTINAEGKELYGFKHLQALMTCLGLRNIKPGQQIVKKYDRDAEEMQDVMANVFPDLMDRDIGILFETEDYEKKDGTVGTRVVPAFFFQADTELVASEILDRRTQPLKLAGLVQQLKHRPLKATANRSASQHAGGGFDATDDDIPF
ncbi:hypothetical protein [Chitinasiproducens palmae]|uniref:Uncharacterized protein n=1 Tax=Chitinasiproducens palmae TaxID=1770053 RepID=A0A1H2PQY6_9BURK|nr:hypothetical protein [Chitinasiproducens palmae]SDV49242.1 hypothetical protein SAMN05216551_107178 [Chitinasiproducens palmae]